GDPLELVEDHARELLALHAALAVQHPGTIGSRAACVAVETDERVGRHAVGDLTALVEVDALARRAPLFSRRQVDVSSSCECRLTAPAAQLCEKSIGIDEHDVFLDEA